MQESNTAVAVPGVAVTFPDTLLGSFQDRIRPGGRILDFGAGEGQRALALAEAGFRVTLLAETPDVAMSDVPNLTVSRSSFADHAPGAAPYDALLCYDQLPHLSRSDSASLLHRIFSWTAQGSLLFLTALHVDDASYDEVSATWERAGLHSFRSPAGEYRTYLARGVVRNLFRGWTTLHHRECMPPSDDRAADGPRAGLIELVAKRR
jgi:hypothetical protein